MKAGVTPLLLGCDPFFARQLVDPLPEHEQLQQRLERELGWQLQQLELQQYLRGPARLRWNARRVTER